jgi:hypothetical protein
MDVLANGIRRSADLEIIKIQFLRQLVGMAELDALARQRTEEERLLAGADTRLVCPLKSGPP